MSSEQTLTQQTPAAAPAAPAAPLRKRGRPRKYTEEELKEHRREYQRNYYANHSDIMYASQKRWRERKRATAAVVPTDMAVPAN